MQCRGHMLLGILTVKKLFERFAKSNCKKQFKKSLELKRKSKGKVIKYILKEKVLKICLTVR